MKKMSITKTDSLMDFLRYKRKLKKQLAKMNDAQYAADTLHLQHLDAVAADIQRDRFASVFPESQHVRCPH